MDLGVKLTDALLGAEQYIKTLDGEIKVKIPEGVTHGEILRIKVGEFLMIITAEETF